MQDVGLKQLSQHTQQVAIWVLAAMGEKRSEDNPSLPITKTSHSLIYCLHLQISKRIHNENFYS